MEARMKIKMLDAEIETTKRAHAQWIDMREQQRQHMQREQQTYLRAQSGYRAVQEQIDSAKAAMAKFEEGSVPLEAVWEVDTDDVSDFKPFKRAYVFQKQENTESTSSTSSSSGANAGVSCFFVKGNIEAAKERAGETGNADQQATKIHVNLETEWLTVSEGSVHNDAAKTVDKFLSLEGWTLPNKTMHYLYKDCNMRLKPVALVITKDTAFRSSDQESSQTFKTETQTSSASLKAEIGVNFIFGSANAGYSKADSSMSSKTSNLMQSQVDQKTLVEPGYTVKFILLGPITPAPKDGKAATPPMTT